MSSESAAPSPAASTTGDGKKSTAANVSQADVIAHFIKRETDRSAAPQTTDTKAPEAKQAPAESSPTESPSVAEPAPADSPEAETPESTDTPAAPEASETEGEVETEAKADDVLSPESQTLDQKTKDRIQKRIDKEVGKRKALEAQLEQVKAQQQQLAAQLQQSQQQVAAPVQAPIANAPLPDIKDNAALTAYRTQVKEAIRTVEALIDSEAIEQGQPVEWNGQQYTKSQLKAHLRTFRSTIEDTIPAQQEYFQQQTQIAQKTQQVWQQAVQKFPFLAEKDNKEVNETVAYLKANDPAILSSPNAAWNVGLMIMGVRALAAQGKTTEGEKAKPPTPLVKPKPKAPSDQTAVGTTASTPRSSEAARPSVRQPMGNQTAQSTAQYLADMERARQAQRRG